MGMDTFEGLSMGSISDDVFERLGELGGPEHLLKSKRADIWEAFVREHHLPEGYDWEVMPDLGKIMGIVKQSDPKAVVMVKEILLRYRIEKHFFGNDVKLPFLKYQKKIITHENKKKADHYYRCLKNAASVPAIQDLPKIHNDLLVFAEVYQDFSKGKLHPVFKHKNARVKLISPRKIKKAKVVKIYDYLMGCLKIGAGARQNEVRPNKSKPSTSVAALSMIVTYFFPGLSTDSVKSMIFEE